MKKGEKKTKEPTELTVQEAPKIMKFDAETLISQAISEKVPVDTMEKLLAMRRELKAEFAKEEFNHAMSSFQAECPVIKKSSAVNDKSGKARYKFAPIEAIVDQIKPYLQKNGFNYTVDTEVEGTVVTAICKVTHHLGHSEQSKFSIPIDKEAYMNEAQKFASALTFAKRYALCNAFGILTGDTDDDSITYGNQVQNVAPKRDWNSFNKPTQIPTKAPMTPTSPEENFKTIMDYITNKITDKKTAELALERIKDNKTLSDSQKTALSSMLKGKISMMETK